MSEGQNKPLIFIRGGFGEFDCPVLTFRLEKYWSTNIVKQRGCFNPKWNLTLDES